MGSAMIACGRSSRSHRRRCALACRSVDTQLPYNDPGLLADTLLAPLYRAATIYLGWEHIDLVEFTRVMFDRFGINDVVPHRPNSDFETVFVFTIRWGAVPRLEFDVQKEKLGPISDAWPLV